MSFEFCTALPTDIDTNLFAWQRIARESGLPPAAVKVGGRYYLVLGFGHGGDGCLLRNADDMLGALIFSLSLHSGLTIPELAAVANLAEQLNIEANSLPVFEAYGIKGAKNIETLKKTAQLPENILQYLDERPLPFKSLALLTSFENDATEFIAAFIDKNRPSVQALKIFIESVADFREELKACGYDKAFTFPDRRSAIHKEIDDALKILVEKAKPIKITQPDNFETSRLIFSFETVDAQWYANHVAKLEEIKNDVASFSELLKKHDIY